jgi:hypothetical protein
MFEQNTLASAAAADNGHRRAVLDPDAYVIQHELAFEGLSQIPRLNHQC